MRSVYAYPRVDVAEAVGVLDRFAHRQAGVPLDDVPWAIRADAVDDTALYVRILDREAMLRDGWEPGEVRELERALDGRLEYCVMIDVCGRHEGDAEVRRTVLALLERGGVAQDEYSRHPWTPQEIEGDARFDGLRFFDYRGDYARYLAEGGTAG